VLSIDASYKVPKWIMKWGGVKLYDVLESGLNEYGEIIVQVKVEEKKWYIRNTRVQCVLAYHGSIDYIVLY
jgi:hypothetical protein